MLSPSSLFLQKLRTICFFTIIFATLLIAAGCTQADAQETQAARHIAPDTPEASLVSFSTREDVSSSTVNYFSSDNPADNPFGIYEGDEPLKAVTYGPMGELPVEMKRPDIFISFNHPMVPLGKLGDPLTSHPYIKISPPVKGLFHWYGSRLLSFEPSEALKGQKEYIVTVKKEISSLGGKQLKEDIVFSFFNEYLKIVQFYPGLPGEGEYVNPQDVPLEIAEHITFLFNSDIDPDTVKNYIELTRDNTKIQARFHQPSIEEYEDIKEQTLKRMLIADIPPESLPENIKVTIKLKEGAKSYKDNIGRIEDQELSFHTITPFRYVEFSTNSYAFPRSSAGDSNPLFLTFSHPVDEASLSGNINVDLSVSDLEDNIEVWNNVIKLNNLPVEYESTYNVSLKSNIKDIYGRSLSVDHSIPVEIGAATSYSYFPNQGTKFLEAAFAPKIIYEFQNIWEGDWKIDSIEDPYASFFPAQLRSYSFDGIEKNKKHFEVLDLSPYLNEDGKGFVGISWNFSERSKRNRHYSQRNLQVQVTDIGVTTRYGYNRILVWANSLSSGEPIKNATVSLLRENLSRSSARTDDQGLAVFTFDPGQYVSLFKSGRYDKLRIKVEAGSDKVIFEPNGSHRNYRFGVYSTKTPLRIEEPRPETFMFTDRGLYKPGETLTYRGIDRMWITGDYTSISQNYELIIRPQGYRQEPIFTTSGKTTEAGGFYGTWKIDEDIEPGYYVIEFKRDNKSRTITFKIANFRRAEFSVSLKASDRLFFIGDELTAQGEASFLSGGGVSGGSYSAYWQYSPTTFIPPGKEWKQYRFTPYHWGGTRTLERSTGILDGDGKTIIKGISGGDVIPGIPYSYTAELSVQDAARQELSANAHFTVHPASFYIGSKFTSAEEGYWSTFLKAGNKQDGDIVLVSPEGLLVEDSIKVEAELKKHEWQTARMRGIGGRISTRWERVEETIETLSLNTKKGKADFSITPPESGEYSLEFTGTDNTGRQVKSVIRFYATGSSYVQWNQGAPEEIDILPDKDEYLPGETAKLLVKSPIEKGKFLLTIEREGIFSEEIIQLDGSASVIEIPVKEEYLPIAYVALSSYSLRTGTPKSYYEPDLGKPKGLFGLTAIHISKKPVTYDVEIVPSKKIYAPGETGEVEISVSQNGAPVPNAEVTFLAVDRGVVDLINYHIPDPVKFFYADYKFPLGTRGADSRTLLMDPVTYEVTDLQGGDDKLKKRKDFNPLAVFEPYLKTDENGKVHHSFKFPDTLTTYRTTAIVVDKNKFGRAETEMNVRNPITMRSSLPMSLRYRDTSNAGVILTNLSDLAQEATVSCRAEILTIEGETTKQIMLSPGETVEIPFAISAPLPGQAKMIFTLHSAVLSEELEAIIEVHKPLIRESFTVAGNLESENEKQEALMIPSKITKGFGSLSVSLSGNPLASVRGAIEYMIDRDQSFYDARLSRAMPYVLFSQHLSSLDIIFNKDVAQKFIDSIAASQMKSGGMGPNPQISDSVSPYLSVKTAHFLTLAEKQNFKVPKTVNAKLFTYLSGIYNDKDISDFVKRYALYVLSMRNANVQTQLDEFLEKEDENGIAGYGFLGLSYLEQGDYRKAKQCLNRIKKFIKLGTRSIDLYETYEQRFYFDSEILSLSLLQSLLYKMDDNDDLLMQTSNTITNRQKYGYWGNISDTWWVLISTAERLSGFLKAEQEETISRASLQGQDILEADSSMKEPQNIDMGLFEEPLKQTQRDTLLPLTFTKEGAAPVYYSATLNYALPNEVLFPRDEGFSVYEKITDLEGNPTDTFTAGNTYRIKVVVSSSRDRSMVNLSVPVPSGFDIIDASFVNTPGFHDEGGVNNRIWSRDLDWGTDTEYIGEGYIYGGRLSWITPLMRIMKNEVRYEISHFYAGKQEYQFLVRAVFPGIYPTPGANAQCLYEEEVFGRSSGWLGIIE